MTMMMMMMRTTYYYKDCPFSISFLVCRILEKVIRYVVMDTNSLPVVAYEYNYPVARLADIRIVLDESELNKRQDSTKLLDI